MGKTEKNHQKIRNICKEYMVSSSQDFIEIKKKELKEILEGIINRNHGEQYLKTYNQRTKQEIKLPKKETLLLNIIDKIPEKADLNFLPLYEDDGIVFKYIRSNQTYNVHTQKMPFKDEIQNIIKEEILPDIDKEFKKSEDFFLTQYIQIGNMLRGSMLVSLNRYNYYLKSIIRDKVKEELEERKNERRKKREEKKREKNEKKDMIEKKKHISDKTKNFDNKDIIDDTQSHKNEYDMIFKKNILKDQEYNKEYIISKEFRDELQKIYDKYKSEKKDQYNEDNEEKSIKNFGNEFSINEIYKDITRILKNKKFEYITTNPKYKRYEDIFSKKFIVSIHNHQQLNEQETIEKIEGYTKNNHMHHQITKRENLGKIVEQDGESNTPLIEIQSNNDMHKTNNIQMREILKLAYQGEMDKGFFDTVEGILFHPNMILIYKDNEIQALPMNTRMKEFFYDKNIKTPNTIIDIKHDKESQDKHKEYFKKVLFEVINELTENNDKTDRIVYQNYIKTTYNVKIKNSFKDMEVKAQSHELNGENISENIKKYLEQFIGAFPNIFPKYIQELNISYGNEDYTGKKDMENKIAAMFHIIDIRKKSMEKTERYIETSFTIGMNELEIFSKHPNEYLIILIERCLGKIYKDVVQKDDIFSNVIKKQDLYEARKYFMHKHINKSEETILMNFFIKYGVKYLQKNYKDIPYNVKEYLDQILGNKKQIA